MRKQKHRDGIEPNASPRELVGQAAEKSIRKNSQLVTVAAATVTMTIAAGAGYFLFPYDRDSLSSVSESGHAQSEPDLSPDVSEQPAAGKKKSHENPKKRKVDERKNNSDGSDGQSSSFVVRGHLAFYVLRPIVVTLRPQGRVRYLRVGLAVETAPDAETAFVDRELNILDILNTYLRSLSITAIEDPAAMARIREQIARRIRFVVDDVPVNAVLITDFILS